MLLAHLLTRCNIYIYGIMILYTYVFYVAQGRL